MKKFLEFLKENLDLRNIDNVEAIICSSASACIMFFWGSIIPKPFNIFMFFIISCIFVYYLESNLKQERKIYPTEQENVVLGRKSRTESEKFFCIILFSIFVLLSYNFPRVSFFLLLPLVIYESFLNKKFRKNKIENK